MFVRNFRKDDKGAAAVEFGFVAPVFIGLMLGVYYFGSTAMNMHSVHFALVNAARSVQLNPALTTSEVQTIVTNKMTTLSGSTAAEGVTVAVSKAGTVNGSALTTLTATYPVTFTVPFIGTYTYNYSTVITVTTTAT